MLAISSLDTFLDRIEGWPRERWLAIGRDASPASADDVAALERAIATRRLALAAWETRDAVETLAMLRCLDVAPPAECRDYTAGHVAIERAALALLCGSALPSRTRAALLAPVTARVP